jgi:hypothetical protein
MSRQYRARVNGKYYDTAKCEQIAVIEDIGRWPDDDFDAVLEEVLRAKDGTYLFHGWGGARTSYRWATTYRGLTLYAGHRLTALTPLRADDLVRDRHERHPIDDPDLLPLGVDFVRASLPEWPTALNGWTVGRNDDGDGFWGSRWVEWERGEGGYETVEWDCNGRPACGLNTFATAGPMTAELISLVNRIADEREAVVAKALAAAEAHRKSGASAKCAKRAEHLRAKNSHARGRLAESPPLPLPRTSDRFPACRRA